MRWNRRTAFTAFSAACWASKQRSSQNASFGFGCLALARLPFARRSHSFGCPVGSVLGGIEALSLPQGRTIEETYRVFGAFDVLRFRNDDVYGDANAEQGTSNPAGRIPPVIACLDYQEIQIAVRPQLTPCRRAKKNDLLRLGNFNNPPDAFL